MYSCIEKEYSILDQIRKFDKFYFRTAAIILLIDFFLLLFTNINKWFVISYSFLLLLIIVIMYFNIEFKKTLLQKENKETIKKKIEIYFTYIRNKNIKNLTKILKYYDVKTKEDIKLMIYYYNNKIPKDIKSSYLEKISTSCIAIASFLVVFYNDVTNQIDLNKLFLILGSTFAIILFIIVMILLIKFIIGSITPFDKFDLYSDLEEYLTTIYINFDKLF